MTSDSRVIRWVVNHIEIPLANKIGHGDVAMATREIVFGCAQNAGLKVERFDIRKGMRLYAVIMISFLSEICPSCRILFDPLVKGKGSVA